MGATGRAGILYMHMYYVQVYYARPSNTASVQYSVRPVQRPSSTASVLYSVRPVQRPSSTSSLNLSITSYAPHSFLPSRMIEASHRHYHVMKVKLYSSTETIYIILNTRNIMCCV